MNYSDKNKLEFFGGEKISFLPTVIYIGIAMFLAFRYDFLSMKSVIVGGSAGILVGFLFAKDKEKYWEVIISGIMQPGNAKLLFTFVFMGCFTKLLSYGQIGQGFVWISQTLNLSGGTVVLFIFLASMVISMGCGTPITAIYAIVPILYPPGIILGANPAVLLGAIISGIFLGDNLSPSSQITATAASMQTNSVTGISADPITVLADRIKYVVFAGLISAILFYMKTNGAEAVQSNISIGKLSNPKGLLMLIPLGILLLVCVKTKNLLKGITFGILSGLVIGYVSGLFGLTGIVNVQKGNISGILFEGVYSMVDVVIGMMILFSMIQIMVRGEGIQKASNWVTKFKFVQSPIGAELVIGVSCIVANILLSSIPLPAILLISSFINNLGHRANLHPSRRSYFLVGMMHNLSVVIPFSSVFVMSAMTMAQGLNQQYKFTNVKISGFDIFSNSYYLLAMTFIGLLWIFAGLGRKYQSDNKETLAEQVM
jgi:Na+/H+ antiporter NhaC